MLKNSSFIFRNAKLIAVIALFMIGTGCSDPQPADTQAAEKVGEPQAESTTHNVLSKNEKALGWKLLFDGKTTNGWHNYGKAGVSGWKVENGELIALSKGGGDIVSDEEYKNFELFLEWKISPEGNSGIFFRVIEDTARFGGLEHTGPEYQLLDDEGWPGELEEWQKTGCNYAMHLATSRPTKPVGQWNKTTILVKSEHVEHWLNGELVVNYDLWTPEWLEMKEKGKWKDYPKYGLAFTGRIGLQDHGNKTWFRNIKIRHL